MHLCWLYVRLNQIKLPFLYIKNGQTLAISHGSMHYLGVEKSGHVTTLADTANASTEWLYPLTLPPVVYKVPVSTAL